MGRPIVAEISLAAFREQIRRRRDPDPAESVSWFLPERPAGSVAVEIVWCSGRELTISGRKWRGRWLICWRAMAYWIVSFMASRATSAYTPRPSGVRAVVAKQTGVLDPTRLLPRGTP